MLLNYLVKRFLTISLCCDGSLMLVLFLLSVIFWWSNSGGFEGLGNLVRSFFQLWSFAAVIINFGDFAILLKMKMK